MSAKENLTNLNTWIRGAFIILFGIVFYIAYGWLIWLLVLFQFVTKLLTGKPNEQLLEMSPKITEYAHDILRYVTFQTDTKPWPLSQTTAGEDSEPFVEPAPVAEVEPQSSDSDSPHRNT